MYQIQVIHPDGVACGPCWNLLCYAKARRLCAASVAAAHDVPHRCHPSRTKDQEKAPERVPPAALD